MPTETRSLNAVVLVNSASPGYLAGRERVLPYLEHFGIPYDLVDLLYTSLPAGLDTRPLIVVAHPRLDPTGNRLGGTSQACLRDALRAGAGLVSFDPGLSAQLLDAPAGDAPPFNELDFGPAGHPVTALHEPGQTISLVRPVQAVPAPGEALLSGARQPFLGAARLENGRLLTWATPDWMDTHVLGPLSGLDDLFWRGLVWAARKPFCLRGLPPLVTFRIDDVAGWGGLWGETPLNWVEDSIRLGWKPWLGLFIYNNSPEAVRQLHAFTQSGQATAFPHAFGRPNRLPEDRHFYYPNAIDLRAGTYDEFIYFDHQRRRPWSDAEAARGLRAVDDWLAAHAPLPVSRVALPHWYEMGANTVRHTAEQWGCDLTGRPHDIDLALEDGHPWLPLGPFRRFEPPAACYPLKEGLRSWRPVYYADFINLQGSTFFNSLTEIHDDYGYEWAPDNNVAESVARGLRQLRRALDSMALASLFTHETDFIYLIRPDNWRAIMEGITRGLASVQPIQVTLDQGMTILRETKTSRLEQVRADPSGRITARLTGRAGCPTTFYRYDDDSLAGRLVDVPAFEGQVEVEAE